MRQKAKKPLLNIRPCRRTIAAMTANKAQGLCYSVWPTAWGSMGAVASRKGLHRVVLPHYQFDDLLALLEWEHHGAVRNDEPFEQFTQLSRDYFSAKGVDFSAIECDLPPESNFSGLVLRACGGISYGQTLSYSQLARQIDRPDAARAVATALSKNRLPLVIPCHRVTYADGSPGGFSAAGGVDLKKRMLDLERQDFRP